MDIKRSGLPLEGIKALIRSQEGEFIIHVEFGKGAGVDSGKDEPA